MWTATFETLMPEIVKGLEGAEGLLASIAKLPLAKPPIVREGSETQKKFAKLAFQDLCPPAKNLILGLTDLETQVNKCRILLDASQELQIMNQFKAAVDSLLAKHAMVYEENLDLFRECEERFVREWTAISNEQDIAKLTQAVVKCVKKMDEFAKTEIEDPTIQEMQTDLRSSDEGLAASVFGSTQTTKDSPLPVKETQPLQKLFKKSQETFRHARECFEFLKRRVHAQDELHQVKNNLRGAEQEARVGAEARFGLHKVLEAQVKGTLQPKQATDLQSWTSLLEKKEDQTKELLDKLKRPEEEVREGPQIVTKNAFRELSTMVFECENEFAMIQKQSKTLRLDLSRAQRMQQEQNCEKLKSVLVQSKWSWPIKSDTTPEIDKLSKARRMMIEELNALQKTQKFKTTDIDIIFQSVQAGLVLSRDAEAFERTRKHAIEVERVIRQVDDARNRMNAILV